MGDQVINTRLVIDACVGISASAESEDHQAVHSYNVLKKVLDMDYFIVTSPKILEEWKPVKSAYSGRWFSDMINSERAEYLNDPKDNELRKKLYDSVLQNDRVKMKKDYHLVEAAILTDNRIMTLENSVRKSFAKAAQTVNEISDIIWVNPEKEGEKAIEWLEAGAPPEDQRMLKNYQESES